MLRILETEGEPEQTEMTRRTQPVTAPMRAAINAVGIIWGAWGDGFRAYRAYQLLRSMRIPHDEALKTALEPRPRSSPRTWAITDEIGAIRIGELKC